MGSVNRKHETGTKQYELKRQTQSAVPVARRGAVVKALGLFELFEDIVQIAGARVLRREESVAIKYGKQQ
jgi:hypothetical protein